MWSSEQVEEFLYSLLDIIHENKQLKMENRKLMKEKEISDSAFNEIASNNMRAIADNLATLTNQDRD